MSISRKMMLIVTVAALLIVGFGTALTYVRMRETVVSSQERYAVIVVGAMADMIPQSAAASDIQARMDEAKSQNPQIKDLLLVEGNEAGAGATDTGVAAEKNGDLLKVYAPVSLTEGSSYRVEAFFSIKEELDSLNRTFLIVAFFGFLVMVGALIGVWGFSNRYMVNPIKRLNLVTKRVADGDLTGSLESAGFQSRDEIGDLYTSVSTMTGQLKVLIQHAQDASEQVYKLSVHSEEVNASAYDANLKAAALVNEIDARTTAGKNNIQDIHMAMEGISKGIEQIAGSAEAVAASSQTMLEKADNGEKVAGSTLGSIEAVANRINSTAEKVGQLAERTEEITGIAEMIKGVANQTNLLALNASIEAARAGEAGRGFSVVASEIRKLAEQSEEAVDSISGILEHIRPEMDSVVTNIEQAVADTDKGLEATKVTVNSFKAIREQISQVNSQVVEVTSHAEEMTASAQEAATVMGEISSYAAFTSDSASDVVEYLRMEGDSLQQTVDMASTLSGVSITLNQTLQKFRT